MATDAIYSVFRVVVPANSVDHIDAVGSYLSVIESNLTDFALGIDGRSPQFIAQGITVKAEPGEKFKQLTIDNSDNGAQLIVRLGVGSGDIRDGRLSVTAPLTIKTPTGLVTPADFSVPITTRELVLAANASRTEARIGSLAANALPFRIGDVNIGSTRGIELLPGETIALKTTAAIYAFNTSGVAAQSVSLMEVTQ